MIGITNASLLMHRTQQPDKKGTVTMMRYMACAVLSLLLLGCGGGSPFTLTQENLDKIHDDMSPSEVRGILGSPTDSKDEPIPIVGGTQTTYTYRNDKSQVVIVFKNDQVKEKHGTFGQ
jgi:hypothetical protein